MSKVIDMTTGSPFKNIIKFALPIGLGFALQNLYSLGDLLIVSLSRGSDAMTGVSITNTVVFMMLGLAQGMAAGFGIVLSQYVGAKHDQSVKRSFATGLMLCIIIGVVLSVVSFFLARPILVLMQTNEQFLQHAVGYLQAIFIGVIFSLLYNFGDQVLRAMGDSKTPLFILILCAVLNIGLNSLLFLFDGLNASWAGWATIISQAVSAIIEFMIILKKFPLLRLKRADFKLERREAIHHVKMGLPMSIQFVITASGCMVQQSAFNMLSDPLCVVAQGPTMKIDNIFGSFINGAGVAMATYVGQNYGAGDYGRIKQGYFSSLVVGLIFTAVSTLCMLTLAMPMVKIMLPPSIINGNPTVVYDYAKTYILIHCFFYYFLFLIFQGRQCLQGIGKGGNVMMGGAIELIARVVVAFTFAKMFGYVGACFSNPIAWICGGIYLQVAFFFCFKRLVNKVDKIIT